MKTSIKTKNKIKVAICAIVCAVVFCSFATPVALSAKAVSIDNYNFETQETISTSSKWTPSTGTQSNGAAEIVVEEGTSNKALKIYSTDDEATKYGVKTKSTAGLTANRYYKLEVKAKAAEGTKFSIGLSNGITSEFEITAQSSEWQTYTLFIETGVVSTANCNVELWLGSRAGTTSTGSVLFDNVKLDLVNYDAFQIAKRDLDANTQKIHSERVYVESNSLSTNVSDWTISPATGADANRVVETTSAAGDKALYSENWTPDVLHATNTLEDGQEKDSEKLLTLTSSNISLNPFGIYRISFFAKSISEKSYLNIKLVANDGPNTTQSTGTNGLSATASVSYNNNWTEYVFFVRTGYTNAANAKFVIEIEQGSEVCFDNFVVQRVLYSAYSSGSNKIDLMPSIDKGIENGFFQIANDPTMKKPFAAYGWNAVGSDKDSDKVTMGIVALDDFDSFGLGAATNPGYYKVNGNDVVLKTAYAISATEASYAGIESTSIKITKSKTSYAILSVYVQTQNSANATASLYLGTQKIAEIKDVTGDGWQQLRFFIKPSSDMTLTLKISLGNEETKSSGTVFISSATCITTTEDVYAKAQENETTKIFDQTSFFAHTSILSNGVYEPVNFTVSTNKDDPNAVGGILDIATIGTNPTFSQFASNFENDATGEYLALLNSINGTSSITHKKGITNSTTGYVKVSFKIKLIDVEGNVKVSLGKLGEFSIDQSNMEQAEDGWLNCTMFVKTGSNTIGTINSELTLQNKGLVLLDEITTKTVKEDDYVNAIKNASQTTKTADLSTQLTGKANKKSTLASNPTAIFFIVLSSLLLVGTVLFVLVSKAVKRLPNRTVVNIPDNGIKPKNGNSKNKSNKDKGFV